jgi:L-ascorbate metabolism protein UlaG (beta-lactamase superfamily)
MEVQFYGANCLSFTIKGLRIVVDDNLAQLGDKSITKPDDISLFTSAEHADVKSQMTIDVPGEYEIGDVSIRGIQARSHMDKDKERSAIIYKLLYGGNSYLICGHIYPDLSEQQLETINLIDVLLVPVGGNGYTLDAIGAQKVIRQVDPKLVVPTHFEDASLHYEVPQAPLGQAIKEMGMEPKETLAKLKLKPGDLADVTQLTILEKS